MLALFVVGVSLLALGGYLTPVTQAILSPIVDAQTWISSRFQALQELLTAPADLTSLRLENDRLKSEIARLQGEVVNLQQQVADTEILETLLGFARANPSYQYKGARVIGRDPSPFLHYVIIDRGSDDGLRPGMPVVTDQGLVGRISAVSALGARVQLITDPASSVNVLIQPSEADARLLGSITGDISIDLIPQEITISSGNLVLTSGLGGNYPANVLVGQVNSVRQEATALFQIASVQPAVDFSKLELVLIIVNFQPIDITPLIP